MLSSIDSSAELSSSMELPDSTDILIIGGGIAGIATAHGIARIQPSCRVLVVEQAPTICSVTTAAAGGGFRCWWPESAEMGKLARTSVTMIREEISEGDATSIEFLDKGYTMLSARAEHVHTYLEQASKASANGGGPIWLNGHLWQPGSPISLENNQDNTFDIDAYLNRHDGIDVINCTSIIRQVLSKHQNLNDSSESKFTKNMAEDLALDDIKAMLHVRNGGHLNPVAFGHHIATRAKKLGNVTIATNIKLVDIIYESDNSKNTNKSKKVVAAAVRNEITNKEQTIQTSTIILAVGPYLPTLGKQLDIQFAVINEPHGRVLFDDPLAAGPSFRRSWLFWSDPVTVQTGNSSEAASVFPPNASCRPWHPPNARPENNTLESGQQFIAVWTYSTRRHALSSPEEVKTAAMETEFTIPPQVPDEYPANVLQGLLPFLPRLKAYFPDNWSPDQPLDCVNAVHTGYYCKTNNNHPMIGPVSHDNKQHELNGLWVCGALGGHGIMIALGCGHLLAQRLLDNEVIHIEPNKNQSQYFKDGYNGLFNVSLGKFIYSSALTANQM